MVVVFAETLGTVLFFLGLFIFSGFAELIFSLTKFLNGLFLRNKIFSAVNILFLDDVVAIAKLVQIA